MSASAWVSGSTLANAVSAPGSAVIGKSAPAKNQGTIATAGVAAMYSSCSGMRLASVSAIPYMNTANRIAAGTNQATPLTVAWKWAPRAMATPISTATWRAATASTTTRLPSTSRPRRRGVRPASRVRGLRSWFLLLSGGFGEAIAGEPQVDVVEGGLAGADGAGG